MRREAVADIEGTCEEENPYDLNYPGLEDQFRFELDEEEGED